MIVTFGDKIARILETSENLLTVVAPPRYELDTATPVNVTIANKYSSEVLTAEKQLIFTYIPPTLNASAYAIVNKH